MNVDLHSHTTASDGALSPQALLAAAAKAGVDLLAITDHDTVAGLAALDLTTAAGPRIVPGVEFSSHWSGQGIHVVGLNLDPDSDALARACAQQGHARRERAAWIAARLAQRGVEGALAGASRLAGTSQIGRPHFARFLVEGGHVRNEREAYRRYLGRHDHGSSVRFFAPMDTAIAWISAAGGTAVLAHPLKYGLTRSRLERLLQAFREAGGGAVEVVCGKQQARATEDLARMVHGLGLAASRGSDFHRPGLHWASLGAVPSLPAISRPVWECW